MMKSAVARSQAVGMFQTTSIDGGRVRYLGVLTDPNELALATALALILASVAPAAG